MELNIQIPDNTAALFDSLQKGQFISSNSCNEAVRDMYDQIDDHFEALSVYFAQIGYTLETFGAGFRFQPEQILVEANLNVMLQNKLDGLRKHFSDKDVRKDVLDNMIRQLTKESFLELENEKTNTYKVMSSWHYLERLIESIQIYDDTETEDNEKPE